MSKEKIKTRKCIECKEEFYSNYNKSEVCPTCHYKNKQKEKDQRIAELEEQLKNARKETANKVVKRVEELSVFDFKTYEDYDFKRYTITDMALENILKEYGEKK